jgi:hypothetical protein
METQQLIEGTPEERAAKVESALRCTLERNGVSLRRGTYQGVKEGKVCEACALGTLALSLGLVLNKYGARSNRRKILDLAAGSSFLSRDEAMQLELGFEGVSCRAEALGFSYEGVTVDRSSPFYQLGARLSADSVGNSAVRLAAAYY